MSELPPEARALLAAARRDHGPGEADRERVLESLHARLGIAVLPVVNEVGRASAGMSGPRPVQPPAPVFASKALGWSKLLAWKAGKAYLATLVIGGGALGVSIVPHREPRRDVDAVVVQERASPAREPSSEAREPVAKHVMVEPTLVSRTVRPPVAAARGPAHRARQVRSVSLASAPSVARRSAMEHEPLRSARAEARQEQRRRAREERELLAQDNTQPVPRIAPPTEDAASSLGIAGPPSPEFALIRAALTSLRDRDPQQALRLLDEHAARYPSGAFSTERRALHAVALCASGRYEQGSRERAAFLQTSGDAPIAARVRSACPR